MNIMTIGLRSAFAMSLLAGCFTRPSDRYACIEDSECNGGRTCGPSGFCVLPEDGGDGDATPMDDGDPCTSFGSRHFDACSIPDPMGPMSMPGPGTYIYNTSDGTLLDLANNPSTPPNMLVGTAGSEMRVVSVESFSLPDGAILRVKGNYPLVIASWSTIDLGGRIEANSTSLERGPGAMPIETPTTFCTAHAPATQPDPGGQGGGGGAGGTMQSAGGAGGEGADGSTNEPGGTPGTPAGATPPLLAAGCPGQTGGNGRNAQPAGAGGLGGGAVQLTAKTSISLVSTARINVSGAGGRPGTNDSAGAGGGGSGGMIGFEAPMLTILPGALLAANGGGGAQGGGSNGNPGAGQDGQLSVTPANGGTGGSGGEGGTGSTSPTAAGNGSPDGAGGGGGGGGAGYITIKAATQTTTGATFSPPLPTIVN